MDNEQIKIIQKLWKRHSRIDDNIKDYVLKWDNFKNAFEEYYESFPVELPVKPACEIERPKLENFLPEDTTTDMVNNMFLENNELYNYINALDHYIDHLESKSV